LVGLQARCSISACHRRLVGMISRTTLLLALLSCDADPPAATGSTTQGGGGDAGASGAQSGSMGPQGGSTATEGGTGGQGGEPPSNVLSKLEQIIAPLVDPTGSDASRTPGLVAVYVSPTEQHVVGVGLLAPGGPAVTGQSVFQLGSVSKAITGFILAAQAIDGLDVERPANELLGADVRLPTWGGVEISLKHLVTHYGALPNFPMPTTGPSTSPYAGYSRANLASFLDGLTLSAAPGADYAYSNLGSGTLGLALADAFAGGSYRTLLADNVTVPLAMSDTDLADPEFLESVADRLMTGHRVGQNGMLVPVEVASMGVLAGGGEILSTGDDVKTLLLVLSGLQPAPVEGTVELAIEPVAAGEPGTDIAFAWNVTSSASGAPGYSKAGLTAGYTAYVVFRRDDPRGIAILSGRGGHMDIQAAALQMLALSPDPR
jgi:D-alanyl-D-alanine-carboxypeptidase/D-alanyl-D-alanine-endopeptidase